MTEPSQRTDRMNKGERALQLLEKGLSPQQIAERIGSSTSSVATLIAIARKARERAHDEA